MRKSEQRCSLGTSIANGKLIVVVFLSLFSGCSVLIMCICSCCILCTLVLVPNKSDRCWTAQQHSLWQSLQGARHKETQRGMCAHVSPLLYQVELNSVHWSFTNRCVLWWCLPMYLKSDFVHWLTAHTQSSWSRPLSKISAVTNHSWGLRARSWYCQQECSMYRLLPQNLQML